MAIPILAAVHSGRTDANGGHRDNKNASGLGYYHYHHGYSPHLHPGGVCPYDSLSSTQTTTPTKPKIDYKVKVNGSEISFGQAPYEKGDYVYVPLRPICDALDASTMVWDEETKAVTTDKEEKRVICKLYSNTATVDDLEVNINPTIIQKIVQQWFRFVSLNKPLDWLSITIRPLTPSASPIDFPPPALVGGLYTSFSSLLVLKLLA